MTGGVLILGCGNVGVAVGLEKGWGRSKVMFQC